jgi:hypothetical protein
MALGKQTWQLSGCKAWHQLWAWHAVIALVSDTIVSNSPPVNGVDLLQYVDRRIDQEGPASQLKKIRETGRFCCRKGGRSALNALAVPCATVSRRASATTGRSRRRCSAHRSRQLGCCFPGWLLTMALVQAILAVSPRAASSNQRDGVVMASDETTL